MKVVLNVDTRFDGPRRVGDILDVNPDIAKMWERKGIASPLETPEEIAGQDPEDEEVPIPATDPDVPINEAEAEVNEEEVAAVDYSEMTAKQLYEECKAKGIEVEAKQAKQVYIDLLTK